MGMSMTASGAGAKFGTRGRIFLGTLVLNVADAILHVATDQVEMLRIASNLLLIVTSAAFLLRPAWARSATCLAAAGLYFTLNALSVATQGIGPPGIMLIAASTLLLSLAALLLRSTSWRRDKQGLA